MTDMPVDAIALLKADHREAEALFEKFEKAKSDAEKQKIATQVCNALKVHTTIEEDIFYPALRGKIDDDMLDEAYVEHDGAKVLINDILAAPGAEFYDAKVTVLGEEISHHVHEEEANSEGMFAKARKTDVDLVELGRQMKALKDDLMPQAEANSLPPAKTRAVNA
ncbi:Hemerythrin-like domain-containing protein [Sphingomonas antarctica]|uniref:hemerythrin domain-containing protein n=1 Tax=Sphingomonas antarctica TaxID=2040274 RepID=UPI0039E88458